MSSEALNLHIDDLEKRFGVRDKKAEKCAEHGDYVAILGKHSDLYSGCPVCHQLKAERERIEQARLDREKAERDRMAARLGNALIPPRFAGKTFETYSASTPGQVKNLRVCQEYAERFPEHHEEGRCLLLLGNPGTGKTHLAAAIADHVIHNSRNAVAVYRTVTSILQFIKGSFDSKADYTESEAFEALIEPHLLIIDEAGATKGSDFEMATIFTVINGRYENLKPTILISNLMPKELPQVIGERCVDRLRENGGIALVFDWESERGKKP